MRRNRAHAIDEKKNTTKTPPKTRCFFSSSFISILFLLAKRATCTPRAKGKEISEENEHFDAWLVHFLYLLLPPMRCYANENIFYSSAWTISFAVAIPPPPPPSPLLPSLSIAQSRISVFFLIISLSCAQLLPNMLILFSLSLYLAPAFNQHNVVPLMFSMPCFFLPSPSHAWFGVRSCMLIAQYISLRAFDDPWFPALNI